MSAPEQSGPSMAAIMSSQAGAAGGGGSGAVSGELPPNVMLSGAIGRLFGSIAEDGYVSNMFKDTELMAGMKLEQTTFLSGVDPKNLQIFGGLLESLRGFDTSDKFAAWSGAGTGLSDANGNDEGGGGGDGSAFSQTASASQGFSGEYAGDVSMFQMGGMAPDNTPSVGAGRGASMEV